MRLTVTAIFVVAFFTASYGLTFAEETEATGGQPTPRYTVLCQSVDQNGDNLIGPILTLSCHEVGTVRDGSFGRNQETVFDLNVVGPERQGCISLHVTATRTQGIGEVEPVNIGGRWVTRSRLHSERIEFFGRARVGQVLVIPIGNKGPNGAAPRVEVMVSSGDQVAIPPNWVPGVTNANGEMKSIFDTLVGSGAAKIRFEKVTRWQKCRGHNLYADIQMPLNTFASLSELYCRYVPHTGETVDLLHLLSIIASEPSRWEQLEAVFGYSWIQTVELYDSPLLLRNLELISRLPEGCELVLFADPINRSEAQALSKAKNISRLQWEPRLSAAQHWQVGMPREEKDRRHLPVVAKPDTLELRWGIGGSSSHPTAALGATVMLRDAKAAIAYLKTEPNLESVVVVADSEDEENRLAQAKAILEQSLPKATVRAFAFTGRRQKAR